ncbi:HNH endonuclease [Proteus mirabilis]|uniref:HNH endonuclease n=1 Tax=Proteus mirabilis TaxID=584 RepID=UPI001A35BAF6|nr:HNH endonuclease [Proteus mirabilis]MBI6378983.1 HNH endonuclease [Proteus mirabilis]MCL8621351.1 HNH endonuclease [Proteus mirabilis]MCL8631534.1 HNH endonuclease [Proteus mirabilis]MCU9579300.1 HNH endonuclease [Proteus mirabilis]
MLKLEQPTHTYEQVLEHCCLGITGNNELLQKVISHRGLLCDEASDYIAVALTEELYAISSTINQQGLDDPIVIGTLRKSELIKLYNTYFVKSGKPGREIYDVLIAAANEKCPFCGGIGRPRNLDHYLPKAHYPQFSILPVNLVPSCRDCNMDGKGESFAISKSEQVIQPYLDNDRYFNEQWIFARYITNTDNEPGVIEYFVHAPEHWSNSQKQRVINHFNDFSLGLRFSKEASVRLVTYLAQIKKLQEIKLDIESAKEIILRPIIDVAPFVNHWDRVMCLTLLNEL